MKYPQMAFRGEPPPPIGPVVEPPQGAEPIEQIVAFLGRTP